MILDRLLPFQKRDHTTQAQPDGEGHLIEMIDVVKNYVIPAGVFTALKGINLRVDRGEFVAIIGKSGSGKSTLINMLTGIDHPTSGEIFINATPIHQLNEQQLAIWRGKNVGVVFQFFQLLPTLSCVENVMLPMDLCGMYKASEWRARALDLLDLVDVREHADKLPSEVSGGQQQRVAIARALANDPPILVADEPTGNLDSVTAEAIFQLFDRFVARGKTILVVTHDVDLAKRVNRTLIIADGEVIEEYLARTFPTLSEREMAWITREIEHREYAPNEVVLEEGSSPEYFYIIIRGGVDVFVNRPQEQPTLVAHLTTGQFFGEIELVRGGQNLATIRASHQHGAELGLLKRAAFERLVSESGTTKDTISRTMQERASENVAARSAS